MPCVLGLYVPSPGELFDSLVSIGIAFAVLASMAFGFGLHPGLTIPMMALGTVIALGIDARDLFGADLGDYGDLARAQSGTDHGDVYFAFTAYFHVGRGKLVAFAGMAAGILVAAVVHAMLGTQRPDSTTATRTDSR